MLARKQDFWRLAGIPAALQVIIPQLLIQAVFPALSFRFTIQFIHFALWIIIGDIFSQNPKAIQLDII
jgi:hypothetical protein